MTVYELIMKLSRYPSDFKVVIDKECDYDEYVQKFTNYPSNVVEFECESKYVHPTQKPIALMEYLVKTYSNEGDTVLDFTMGSGTTGVACINTNRDFIGIEIDSNYFNIASERLNNIKNKQEIDR